MRAEPPRRTVLMADLNGTLDDRARSAVTSPAALGPGGRRYALGT
ncbi:hypothetical protein [Streptomyces malaysiensis]